MMMKLEILKAILHEKEVFEKDIDKLFILSEDKGE